MAIKIIIADDHQLFREGLINLLADTPEIEIVAHAENGKDAIEKAIIHHPDIIIMDIGMPIKSGIEATIILKDKMPNVKIIALSMHSDNQYIKGMLEAGASGYLLKSCTYNKLIEAINMVYSGKKYFGEEITNVILDDYLGKEKDASRKDPKLSQRESEILKLFAEGKSSREISVQLFISIKTVGTHKQHILEKLELKTTTDIVKYAIKNGIISLE